MNTLVIDTSSNKEIIVGVRIGGKEDCLKESIGIAKAQIVLPLIDKLLKKHKLSIKNVDGIEVHVGPGSFTGLRVGVAVANTLAFTLDIPVNGKKQIEELRYSA